MPRGYATRTRTLRAHDRDADKNMWQKMLEKERAEITKLRARVKELEASARVTAMTKTPRPTWCNKIEKDPDVKCRELVMALRKDMRQSHSIFSEKLADLGAIHEETQRRLQVLEMYHSNHDIVEVEDVMAVEGEEEQELKDEGPIAGFNELMEEVESGSHLEELCSNKSFEAADDSVAFDIQDDTKEYLMTPYQSLDIPSDRGLKECYVKIRRCHRESKKTALAQHKKAVKKRTKKFKCDHCDLAAVSKADLTKHIKAIHEKIKDFTCQLCGFMTSSQSTLALHIKAIHDKIKDHKCDLCSYATSYKQAMINHLKGHTDNKDYVCDKCPFATSVKPTLARHKSVVHEKVRNFRCDKCNLRPVSRKDLMIHIKSVHDKIKDFTCTKCEYATSRERSLKQHIKVIHNKVKDYRCFKCDYMTASKQNLLMHIKAHNDKKMFKCDKCDCSLGSKTWLERHKKVHSEEGQKKQPCEAGPDDEVEQGTMGFGSRESYWVE